VKGLYLIQSLERLSWSLTDSPLRCPPHAVTPLDVPGSCGERCRHPSVIGRSGHDVSLTGDFMGAAGVAMGVILPALVFLAFRVAAVLADV
jgi:hypothetical protein